VTSLSAYNVLTMIEMIIWFFIVFVVTFVSLLLTMRSLQGFREKATQNGLEYGLYLVRYPHLLSPTIIDTIAQKAIQNGAILSLEKLAKGSKKALVIYGPRVVLESFVQSQSFLEIEDYTLQNDHTRLNGWELGINTRHKDIDLDSKLDSQMPFLEDDDQLWWQVTLRPKSAGLEYKAWQWVIKKVQTYIKIPGLQGKKHNLESLATIRAIYLCDDDTRRHQKMPQMTKI
jgi:hypothetical protein